MLHPGIVFVIGGRRTGTTLVNAILCSDAAANPLLPEAQPLTRILEAQQWTLDRFDRFGRPYFGGADDVHGLFAPVLDGLIGRVAARYPEAATLVLKNPELSKVAGAAAAAFPEARFVVCVRDPRDQVASEMEVGERRIAAGIGSPLVKNRRFDRLTEYFLGYYEEPLRLHRDRPDRLLFLRYEDVVSDVDGSLAALRRHTGLALADFDPDAPWRSSPEFAAGDGEPWQTPRYGSGIDGGGVGRYRHDLDREAIAVIEDLAAGFMDRFGYA